MWLLQVKNISNRRVEGEKSPYSYIAVLHKIKMAGCKFMHTNHLYDKSLFDHISLYYDVNRFLYFYVKLEILI